MPASKNHEPSALSDIRTPYGRCTNRRRAAASECGASVSFWAPNPLSIGQRKHLRPMKIPIRMCWYWMTRILGFRNDSAGWPPALRQGGNPRRIILRTCTPLGDGLLWKRLLESYADRLDVVVSVSALRTRGASISQSLSWDRTIEETVAEFGSGIFASDLALVRRVVVHFGSAGAAGSTRLDPRERSAGALIDRVSLERFLYHPDDQETDWEIRHPGATLDGSAILVAALVRMNLGPNRAPSI